MKNNVLYFEGAGWSDADSSKATNVGNCRIRTAFTNDKGKMIYLELSSGSHREHKGKKVVTISEYAMYISACFEITGDHDDENKHSIRFDWQEVRTHNYTKESIVAWVNENLNCSFDTMEVLHDFEDYRVHADNRGYNLMNNHAVNPARTLARIEAHSKIDKEYREHCQEKYCVISIKAMDDDTITVYCHAKEYDRHCHKNQLKDNKPRTAVVNVWSMESEYK